MDISIKTWIDRYNNGDFNNISRDTLINMGGYAWWGSDKHFQRVILKDLAKKIVTLSNSKQVNVDSMYVFFQETLPVHGPKYSEFKICDLETGDVLYCICHLKKGSYGEDFSGWEVWDFTPKGNHTKYSLRGSWKDIKTYFGLCG